MNSFNSNSSFYYAMSPKIAHTINDNYLDDLFLDKVPLKRNSTLNDLADATKLMKPSDSLSNFSELNREVSVLSEYALSSTRDEHDPEDLYEEVQEMECVVPGNNNNRLKRTITKDDLADEKRMKPSDSLNNFAAINREVSAASESTFNMPQANSTLITTATMNSINQLVTARKFALKLARQFWTNEQLMQHRIVDDLNKSGVTRSIRTPFADIENLIKIDNFKAAIRNFFKIEDDEVWNSEWVKIKESVNSIGCRLKREQLKNQLKDIYSDGQQMIFLSEFEQASHETEVFACADVTALNEQRMNKSESNDSAKSYTKRYSF